MKTTLLGILTIIAAVSNAAVDYINTGTCNVMTLGAGITAGWGLIHAKDAVPVK
jgi:hypothetical protein